MDLICAWCKKKMGEVDADGVSHGICPSCFHKEMEALNDDLPEMRETNLCYLHNGQIKALPKMLRQKEERWKE